MWTPHTLVLWAQIKCPWWINADSNTLQQLILLREVPTEGHLAATPPSVTSIWPGRCNSPTNLPIIAAGLGTCHRGSTDPRRPNKINTIRPSGGPCYPRGCQYCRLSIKEHFISVCDSKGERSRGVCVCVSVCRCPGRPVCIKPRGGPKVMCRPSRLSTGAVTNCVVLFHCSVL